MKLLRKIVGLPNAALRAIAEHAVVRWLRDAGAGNHGEGWQRIYLALQGKKTLLGMLIGGVGFIAESRGDVELAWWLERAGALMFAAGLADKAIRTPGRPEWAANSTWYRFLADQSGLLSALLGSAWAYAVSAGCVSLKLGSLVVTCALEQQALGIVTLALVYLGVIDSAFLSRTPGQAHWAAIDARVGPGAFR